MAIARLNKLKILIHQSRSEELLRFLQEEGSVEIIDLHSRLARDEYSLSFKETPDTEDLKNLDKVSAELLWLIDLMSQVNKTKRYTVSKQEFESIAGQFNYRAVLEEARRIESSLKEFDTSRKALYEEKRKLLPWQKLDVDLKDICRWTYTIKGLGLIRKESLNGLKEEFNGLGIDIYIEPIDMSEHNSYVFFLHLKEQEDKANHIFKKYGLERVYFPAHEGKPIALLKVVEERIGVIDSKRASALDELADLAKHKKEIMVLCDHLSSVRKKGSTSKRLIMTEKVFLIEGWIKKSLAGVLGAKIKDAYAEAELLIEEPMPTDDVPVILENNRFVQPFEVLTKIYGMPAYNEVDPTPFLAPFFFIFFGFCLSDAGYGIVLVAFSLFVLKRFKMGWMGDRFFRLLLYGGVSTILIGALTGGWFGDIINLLAKGSNIFTPLKRLKDAVIVLNPMVEPMKLLVVALSLGVVQIWFGHVVAIYGNLKNRRYLSAILDQGSVFIFLFGFTGVILAFLGALPTSSYAVSSKAFAIGAIAIAATSGRSNPGIVSKFAYGIFNLYNAFSGYISDMLSYSRLWALGLVTGVMGATFNLMAVIIGKMIPVAGVVITVFLIVLGHTMSFLMNLLGAFIHPMRLQFVEFFSKFFKGGGKDFAPLCLENKYTVVTK